MEDQLADTIGTAGQHVRTVDILISYDVVRLLSEQLYASPVKAIEELVVNGWDAGATICSVMVDVERTRKLAVFDNGVGMDADQLGNLWHIGVSHKPPLPTPRKQIGKFGIGKLASYAVARRATYLTKSTDGILSITINFDDLAARTNAATGLARPLPLEIRRLPDLDELDSMKAFRDAEAAFTVGEDFSLRKCETWTLVVLEDLRERSETLAQEGRLRWVLETAMPYSADFRLYLNGSTVESKKRSYKVIVEFDVSNIGQKRLAELNAASGEDWHVKDQSLVSHRFPSGVRGTVVVTEQSLYSAGGKSEDLGRSHGFFVRVHKRLVNETDPLFGARPLSFGTWYHFAAEIEADDLNQYITASRDDFEQSELKPKLRELLIELFNEARERKEALDRMRAEAQSQRHEEDREYVSPLLVEQPLADALIVGSKYEVEHDWSMVDPPGSDEELVDLVNELYTEQPRRRSYKFRYAALGANSPLARLNTADAALTLNQDHPIVQEFADKPDSRRLLELIGIAEALLEAYLREADIPRETIQELLARRDLLLRALSQDESHSLAALSQALRDNARKSDDSKALEISVVAALRALGFATKHVSGSKAPDGLAGYEVYGIDSTKVTIETKASIGTPSLSHIGLDGVRSHAVAVGASGSLLVAPSFPGAKDANSEINLRAAQQQVSCWTTDQLAAVVERAEARHISARDVQRVILEAFGPLAVTARVAALLATPLHDQRQLYRAILDALSDLRRRLTDIPRNISLVAGEVTRTPELSHVEYRQIKEALFDVMRVSRGMVHVTEHDDVILLGDLGELRRRAAPLTELSEPPRRKGTFRESPEPAGDDA